jgi:nitroreductase
VDLVSGIIARVSPGKLVEPAPNASEVDRLISAAVAAPDHGRLRPWRFIVFEGKALDQLGGMMADSLRRRMPSADEAALATEARKVQRAPMIIVVAAIARESARIPRLEQLFSAGAAAENLMLAAHGLGYGANWRTGDFAFDPEAKRALGLAEADEIAGLLYVGTVAAPGRERQIDPKEFIVRWPQ